MLLLNSLVKMVDVFQTSGSVIQKMIAEMDLMKVTFVLKKHVPTSNLLVRERVIVFLSLGFVMVSFN